MTMPYSPFEARVRPDDGNLRVSDAERAEVADRLSQHFGDGRLDQEEFTERLDRAMSAKTRSDLTGLFAGLPDREPPVAMPRPVPVWLGAPRRRHPFLFVVLVVLIVAAAGQALVLPHVPWLLIALVVVLWLRHRHQGGVRR